MSLPEKQPDNVFDLLGFQDPDETKKYLDKVRVEGEKLDNLIHRVFAQNEAGKELLEIWERSLMMAPTAEPGADLITIGMREGTKSFIRNIKLTIDKVENA